MAVRIRLQRQGKPHRPFYKLVAIDQRARRDGKPIETLGQYDPMAAENKLNVKKERYDYWIQKGAQATKTVIDLLKKVQ